MDNLFYGLSLVIAIGAGVAILMRSIRQPLMIGHILTGILVGPAIFDLVKSPNTLSVFGDLGIALLLFIIGLGMNPRVIAEVGRPATIVSVTQVVLTTIVGWLVALALGVSHRGALFLGFGFAINSTIVALKLIGDRKEQGRLYGKLTISSSLIMDIIAAVALVLVASTRNGQFLSVGPLSALIFKGFLIGLAMYLISSKLLPRAQKLIAGDQELLFLFAMAWGLGSAALLAKAGFSLEVGALAAGVSLASLPYSSEIAARLRPLRDFFLIVFFITLGTGLSFGHLNHLLPTIIIGLLVVTVFKPLVILTCLGLLGYTKRTSFMTALTLGQVSEFSIIFVILGVQKHLISQDIVTSLTFIALLSIASSTYLVTFSDRLYRLFERHLELFERGRTHAEKIVEERYEMVLFGYQRGGHEFVNLFNHLKKKYVVIDYDPEIIDTLDHRKINYLYGDATDLELLEEAAVEKAKLVVSTIPDYEINKFILNYLTNKNPHCVTIMHADDPLEAAKLYESGATYVVLPHYIGSEKISAFIGKSGLSKQAFNKERKAHLDYLEKHYGALEKLNEAQNKKFGHAIVAGVSALARSKA